MKGKLAFAGIVFGALTLFFTVNSIQVYAQGPINTNPGTMLVFDNLPHSIPANTVLWYVFFYSGDKSPITITMANAANTGLGFDIYTPNQVQRLRSEDKPLGRGTTASVNCDAGKCSSADLTWIGSSPTGGPYIVKVTNSASKTQVFNMTITGSGVEIGSPLEALPPAPSSFAIAPFTGSFSTPSNPLPENALPVRDNQSQIIPANAALWYRFDYTDTRSPALIALPTGASTGIYLRIFSANQVKNFAHDFAFVGEGSAPSALCAVSACTPNDIVWEYPFSATGTYYVEILNSNTTPMTFRLVVKGKSVTLGQ